MSDQRDPNRNAPDKEPSGNPWMKSLFIWAGILLALVLFVQVIDGGSRSATSDGMAYSEFLNRLDEGSVKEVAIGKDIISGKLTNDETFRTYAPQDPALVDRLKERNVSFSAEPEQQTSVWLILLYQSLPFLLILGIAFFVMRQMQKNAGSGAMGFGKSKAKLLTEKHGRVTFNDVAGIDEAKEELQEIVEFLKNPQKFQAVGGRIPKGVLLVGPPGTGKTLLARAIAGEANVPFFTISGSDFVEMFVGVGASRVRDMFEQAKKHAPCIVFIDEIDAVGRHRGAGLGGGNDEREQTLNQLLVEMDGFEGNEGVIVIAATNRPDVLDPALLRPGRFDRQVVVPLPDVRGREKILQVHMRKVPIAPDVKADVIARGCPGFSGADLANLVNEAALFAARANKRLVDMDDFERAKDKIIMGAERRSIVMPEHERRNTAYHESGHALVAKLMPKTDPVHKVTIIPRGRALGVTMQLPEQDRYSMDREMILQNIAVLFGGRIAEEVFMGQMTTGASNDFERATDLARSMVTRWGMSDELGPMVYGENEGEVFLGRSVTVHKNVSETTMQKVDAEIRRIVDGQYALARKLIEDNRDKVEAMAKALMEWETLDADQINDIMQGRPPRPPKPAQPPAPPRDPGAQPAPTITPAPSQGA